MHPDIEKEALTQEEDLASIHSSSSSLVKPKSTSKLLLGLLLAISLSLAFVFIQIFDPPPSLTSISSIPTGIISHKAQCFAPTFPLTSETNHHILTPFNFSSPVKSYYPWLPEPEKHRYPFFQSTSTPIKLNNSSPLLFLRSTSAVYVNLRTSENREDDSDSWEGETPGENEMIVVAKATWPVIKDWEMKEWGVQEVARIGGGEAVRKGSGESREAVGVWMNVPMQAPPWAKPGHRPPDPNTTYILMSTHLTVVVAPNSKWRDLELTRIPNRNEDFRMWTWPSLDTGSASFGDVLLDMETGGVNAPYPGSSFIAESLTISIDNDDAHRPSFGSVYGNFTVASLNITFGDVGSTTIQLNPHPSLASSSSSANATISVGRYSKWTSDWGKIDLSLPKGSFEGEFDARTGFGDMDVDVVPAEGQVMKIEKVGEWDGGSKKGVGFELVGSISKKEGAGEGEGTIELFSKQGLVNLKIA